eukprot:279294-Karenia_brevis.AAC.1
MHLYISIAKTVLTVFHGEDDAGVAYRNNAVYVDGKMVDIRIYGKTVQALPEFKYLGVVFNAGGGSSGHFDARLSNFSKASGSLLAGLHRIPSF